MARHNRGFTVKHFQNEITIKNFNENDNYYFFSYSKLFISIPNELNSHRAITLK